jgi:hypothetical protein
MGIAKNALVLELIIKKICHAKSAIKEELKIITAAVVPIAIDLFLKIRILQILKYINI